MTITESVETNVRKEQFQRELDSKQATRDIKESMKDVTITESVETNVFKEQFQREQGAKELGVPTNPLSWAAANKQLLHLQVGTRS